MQGLKHKPRANETSAPASAPAPGSDEEGNARAHATRAPDRRHQRRWVPITMGWLCLLIGLADIIGVAIPGLRLHHRMHGITAFVPGTVTNVASTATVIIGLLLLMLSHGLRRRKRRAWQATTVLLAFSAVIHLMHGYRIQGAAAEAVLVVLLYFRGEFYAVGDPRTRWRAAGVFVGLVIADVTIGLTYMLLTRHLAEDYSIWQRTVHTVYGLVGVSGPVQFVPDSRADLFNL